MDGITIEQIVYLIGIISTVWIFTEKIIKSVNNTLDARLNPLTNKYEAMQKDIQMLSDVCYQMLDHMATDNNTGGMKKALDDYNKYNRHNN